MFTFWIGAILLTALAAAPIVLRAARPLRAGFDPVSAVYRRQLAEIDELAARGVLAEGEVKSAHAEAARRLLAAEAPADETGATGNSRLAVVLGVALVGLAAPALYLAVGSPGVADQPFGKRLAEWRASDPRSLQPEEMAAVLGGVVAERPGQIEPLVYLARAQIASGDGPAAARTLLRALKLDPRRADLWTILGQLRTVEAQDEVTPEARDAFSRALALEPTSPVARYFLARGKIEDGDKAAGLAEWRALAPDLAAPEREALMRDIAAAEAPPAAPAVSDAAIRGMVEGLAARLTAEPNDPAGWERLVRSYRVLGDEEKLQAALAQARVQFKGRDTVLAPIEAAGSGR